MSRRRGRNKNTLLGTSLTIITVLAASISGRAADLSFIVTDTGQTNCYGVSEGVMSAPVEGGKLYGQEHSTTVYRWGFVSMRMAPAPS